MKKSISVKNYFFFLVFSLSLFVSGVVDSQDGLQYLAVARNIFYKKEPTAPVYEYGTENGWKNIHMSTYVGANGKTYSPTGLGFSIAFLPSVFVTDIFYHIYGIAPPIHFPLESDWFILLAASFTNIFFAAGVGVLIYRYLLILKVSRKTALITSFLGIFTTNLFALSKHILPHMMFIFFLLLVFYLSKKFFITKKNMYITLAGCSFGILALTYNQTFLLAIPAYCVYYLLHKKNIFKKRALQTLIREFFLFALGAIPLFIIYYWFENTRVADTTVSLSGIGNYYAGRFLYDLPLTVFIEGLFGHLLSPGRSIFIYSPLLLVPFFFWHKLDKSIKPEIISSIILLIVYLCFYATIFSIGRPEDQGVEGFWHGESSWGPRYMSPIIPFGIILFGYILNRIKTKLQKVFIYIIASIGIYVEILGVVMPYQIKFHSLDKSFFINGTQYSMYVYSNLLPRYTPILSMSKNLIKLVTNLPKTLNHGKYNVKFYDGIDFAFNVGPERWRAIEKEGHISFDNSGGKVKSITFDLINHPVADTDQTLQLSFYLNGKKITTGENLKITERKRIRLALKESETTKKKNELIIIPNFENESILKNKTQIVGLLNMYINEDPINLESIDVPYVSQIGSTKILYKYWGGKNTDPWRYWEIHTQIFERVPDFWWFKPLYYWDIQNKPFYILLGIDVFCVIYFGKKVLKQIV